jgi:SAM-dependent methyltransferase
MNNITRKLKGTIRAPLYKTLHWRKQVFECPICHYKGPFKDKRSHQHRKHAKCPKCGALERARLQYLVLREVLDPINTTNNKMLHFAPEPSFQAYLREKFDTYETADLYRKDVDHNVDIQDLPFADASYDFILASHILEYPVDDMKSISEIRRILKPGGIAMLPIPLMHEKTVDRKTRDPLSRMMHEPGLDYFDRFRQFFHRVDLPDSDSFPDKYQLYIHGNLQHPLEIEPGKYKDVVPVCYAGNH